MICRYCSAKYTSPDVADAISQNSTSVEVSEYNKTLTVYGNERTEYCNIVRYEIPIKYCPACGRDLSVPYERNTEQEYSNILRRRIKEELAYAKISICQLAKDTGIAKSTLTDFLAGKIKCLSAGKIAVISDVLKMPIERLFADKEVGSTVEESIETPMLTKENPYV